jgi:hypothetical protein
MNSRVCVALIAFLVSGVCFADEPKSKEGTSKKIDASENRSLKRAANERPEFDIFGSAAVHFGHATPSNKYYDGSNAPSQIKTNQKSNDEHTQDLSGVRACAGEAEIGFQAKGALRDGWSYAACLIMNAMRNDTGMDKVFLTFTKDDSLIVQAGNLKGPEATAACGGQQLAIALFGPDGALPRDVAYATGVVDPVNPVAGCSKATKIVVYGSELYGWRLGVGITPDTKHSGHEAKSSGAGDSAHGNDSALFSKGDTDKERPSGRNNIAVGLTHTWDFHNGWKTKFGSAFITEDTKPIETACYVGDVVDKKSASGVEGQPGYEAAVEASAPVVRRVRLNNAKSWMVSGTVSYQEWSLGVGYLNNGKSRLPKANEYLDAEDKPVLLGGFACAKDGNAGHVYNVGIKRTIGEKWAVALIFNSTDRKITAGQHAKGRIWTLGGEYIVCPGIKFFAEADRICTRSCDYACATYNLVHAKKTAIKTQNATFVAVGAKVSF